MSKEEEPIGGGHDRWFDSHLIKQLITYNPQSIFDVGIGKGYNGQIVRDTLDKDVYLEGIEIFPAYISEKTVENYDNIIYGDIRLMDYRTWQDYSADVVIFGDILEHMEHEEAMRVVESALPHFDYIIINTPLGFLEHPEADGNEWEAHRCGLYPHDFDEFDVLHTNVRPTGMYAGLFNIVLRGKLYDDRIVGT